SSGDKGTLSGRTRRGYTESIGASPLYMEWGDRGDPRPSSTPVFLRPSTPADRPREWQLGPPEMQKPLVFKGVSASSSFRKPLLYPPELRGPKASGRAAC